MQGLEIFARTLSRVPEIDKKHGNSWQYHPRSDRHSRIICWGILFDLLQTSRTLADHADTGRIAFGINHEMRDFKTGRKKNLDLVVCTPGAEKKPKKSPTMFAHMAKNYGLLLSDEEIATLAKLPSLREAPVGEVHIALEAKACMTEHIKARSRLYDELSSSHQTIHGSSGNAIAAGFVMVNLSDEFISPGRNQWPLKDRAAVVTKHRQPGVTEAVVQKIREIPRRTNTQETGFDALALAVVRCRNDGSAVQVVDEAPALDPADVLHYDHMIRRTAKQYESRFWQA